MLHTSFPVRPLPPDHLAVIRGRPLTLRCLIEAADAAGDMALAGMYRALLIESQTTPENERTTE